MISAYSWWMMVVLGGSVPIWHIGGSDRQACLGGSGCHSGHGLHVRASTMSGQPTGWRQTENGWQFYCSLFIYSYLFIFIHIYSYLFIFIHSFFSSFIVWEKMRVFSFFVPLFLLSSAWIFSNAKVDHCTDCSCSGLELGKLSLHVLLEKTREINKILQL